MTGACGKGWPLALLLALLPVMAAAQGEAPPAPACPPASTAGNTAPVYPPAELWRLQGYTVNVILATDGCGGVRDARVERSSGIPSLDAVALHAARNWVIPASHHGHPLARLPFMFEPLPEAMPQAGQQRLRDPFFTERSSGRVPEVALDEAGQLPGYIADPYPIGFLRIPEAISVIAPLALIRRYQQQANFWLHDEEGLSLFQLDDTLLLRNRLVSDGRHRFVVTSVLCGDDLDACRQRLAQLRASRGPQQPLPAEPAPSAR